MYAEKNWYCACRSSELKDSPLGRKIIKRDIVIFRDAQNQATALGATCAHRGGDLTLGECSNGTISCPWHGWRYDSSGACVEIPSLGPEGKIPKLAQVPRYPVHEAQGFVYVWMCDKTEPDWLPHRHDFLHAQYHLAAPGRLQKGIYIHTLETAIEDSHVAFVHSKSIGVTAKRNPGGAQLAPITNIRIDDDGRGASGEQRWPTALRGQPGQLARWLNRHLLGTEDELLTLDKNYRIELTGFSCHTTLKPDGSNLIIYSYVTPADEYTNWFWAGAVDTAAQRSMLGNLFYKIWQLRMGEKVLLEDEEMISSALTQKNPGGHAKPLFVNADSMGLAFRRIYGNAVLAEGKEPAWPLVGGQTCDRTTQSSSYAVIGQPG